VNFLVGVKIGPFNFITVSVMNVKITEDISSLYCANVKSIIVFVHRNE
jgi:hypothetical protein